MAMTMVSKQQRDMRVCLSNLNTELLTLFKDSFFTLELLVLVVELDETVLDNLRFLFLANSVLKSDAMTWFKGFNWKVLNSSENSMISEKYM